MALHAGSPFFLSLALIAASQCAAGVFSPESVVIASYAAVYANASENSKVLGIAGKGFKTDVIDRKNEWICVTFGARNGWIQIARIRKPLFAVFPESGNQPYSPSDSWQNMAFILPVISGAVALLLLCFTACAYRYRFRLKKAPQTPIRRTQTCRRALVIAHDDYMLIGAKDGSPIAISACLQRMGFECSHVFDPSLCAKAVRDWAPDIIAIDIQTVKSCGLAIETCIKEIASQNEPLLFFFNARNEQCSSGLSVPGPFVHLTQSATELDFRRNLIPFLSAMSAKAGGFSPPSCALQGLISRGCLDDVFQLIELGGKTGELIVENDGHLGAISFENGTIVRASAGGRQGKEAAVSLLEVNTGHFRMLLNKRETRVNCRISPTAALMESSKNRDEAALTSQCENHARQRPAANEAGKNSAALRT